jgi:hypothetical protein
MATGFPTSLDALTNPASTDALTSPSHADQHANANDAIEALQAKVGVNGSAVTTSLDYKVSKSALTLITTQTFTNVASVDINSIFSSTYDNYRIVVMLNSANDTAGTGYDENMGFKLRTVSGVATGAFPYRVGSFGAKDAIFVWRQPFGVSTATTFAQMDIFSPFLSEPTRYTVNGLEHQTQFQYTGHFSGTSVTSSWTGLSFFGNSDTYGGVITCTGRIYVYGYGK